MDPLLIILFVSGLALAGSITSVILTLNTNKMLAVLLARPIPTTAFNADVLATLARLDERVKPLPPPAIPPEQVENFLANLAVESAALAQQTAVTNNRQGVAFKGRDKFRVAMEHAVERATALGLTLDRKDMGKRIEALAPGHAKLAAPAKVS